MEKVKNLFLTTLVLCSTKTPFGHSMCEFPESSGPHWQHCKWEQTACDGGEETLCLACQTRVNKTCWGIAVSACVLMFTLWCRFTAGSHAPSKRHGGRLGTAVKRAAGGGGPVWGDWCVECLNVPFSGPSARWPLSRWDQSGPAAVIDGLKLMSQHVRWFSYQNMQTY